MAGSWPFSCLADDGKSPDSSRGSSPRSARKPSKPEKLEPPVKRKPMPKLEKRLERPLERVDFEAFRARNARFSYIFLGFSIRNAWISNDFQWFSWDFSRVFTFVKPGPGSARRTCRRPGGEAIESTRHLDYPRLRLMQPLRYSTTTKTAILYMLYMLLITLYAYIVAYFALRSMYGYQWSRFYMHAVMT